MFDNILNFSGCIILYDYEQYMLFTLNIIPKPVLEELKTVTGPIDSMDFGKLQVMFKSQDMNKVVRRVLWCNLVGSSVSVY
jgi:hypothetical protein